MHNRNDEGPKGSTRDVHHYPRVAELAQALRTLREVQRHFALSRASIATAQNHINEAYSTLDILGRAWDQDLNPLITDLSDALSSYEERERARSPRQCESGRSSSS